MVFAKLVTSRVGKSGFWEEREWDTFRVSYSSV